MKKMDNITLPPEGQGHNAGLPGAARKCQRAGATKEEALAHLRSIYDASRADHQSATLRAIELVWGGSIPDNEDKVTLPELDAKLIELLPPTPLSAIIEATPHKTKIKTISLLKNLFLADEIIGVQHVSKEGATLMVVEDLDHLHPHPSLDQFKFLNPSTFKQIEGAWIPDPETGGKKLSTRCNANVASRPYMLLEMDSKDEKTVQQFSSFAMGLSKFIPLKMVVDTGNKSLHFWFDARAAAQAEVDAIFVIACLYGADKQMAVRSQVARMPNVTAAGEGRSAQRVVYFDPHGEKYPTQIGKGKWDVAGFEGSIASHRDVQFYYHGGKYYTLATNGKWIALNSRSVARQLIDSGVRGSKIPGEGQSPVDTFIAGVEMHHPIDAIMQGASGRCAGVHKENGYDFLVMRSPTLIKPRKGDWRTIKDLLTHMFDHTPNQLDVFYGWCSSSAKAFRNDGKRQSKFMPCQFLHILGEVNSGKTLLLDNILPHLLGGRSTNADAMFSEHGTAFNSDLFQCELLFLDDTSVLLPDFKSRSKLGEMIKSLTVGTGGDYHQKFADKIPVKPWWRFVRLMNLENSSVSTLPQMNDGVRDKIILLKAQSMVGGLIDNTTAGWYEPTQQKIVAELPAFLQFLLEEFVIPPHIVDPAKRFAVVSYHNPSVLDQINEGSPEHSLLERIDGAAHGRMFCQLFEQPEDSAQDWSGTVSALFEILADVGSRNSQIQFSRFCPSPKVLISQLQHLAKSQPDRVTYSGDEASQISPKKKNGAFYWVITPKKQEPVTVEDSMDPF
jgi:hypothetical protein